MEILANKIRPNTLKDFVGQKHLISDGKVISNLIKNQKLFSMILYGPPGTGKTTLANIIAHEINIPSIFLNATLNNKEDFEKAIFSAKMNQDTILIIDEIHRMNKDKQDLLLPYIENGTIILIGLTTANPYIKVNPAIRSRVNIFKMEMLSKEDIIKGLRRATCFLDDIKITSESLNFIASLSCGDMRFAINLLETAYYVDKNITIDILSQINKSPNVYIDNDEDGHYDILSALQKSIRGSDVDASLHYLSRLLIAEDMDSICRRLSVIAYEDIGLANPGIGPRLDAAINAALRVGFPEANIPLSYITVEMALSPKSNSTYLALDKAMQDVKLGNATEIPSHIKKGSKDYKYPHNYQNDYVMQQYLPNAIKDHKYYIPKNNSVENNLNKVHKERMNNK